MEVYEKFKDDLVGLIILVSIIGLLYNLFDLGIDDSDYDGFNRSGFTVHTDAKTGLQYLSKWGVITPRIGNDGKQIRVIYID